MDCLCWVNRDSYLPQGSRGLKVTFSHSSLELIAVSTVYRLQTAAKRARTDWPANNFSLSSRSQHGCANWIRLSMQCFEQQRSIQTS